MGFFKKLFGKQDSKEEQNNDHLVENESQLIEGINEGDSEVSEENIEVIVNDIAQESTIELLDDTEEEEKIFTEPVHEKKSIKEIVEDVTEFMEKSEQATQECNEPEIVEVADLIENIGIVNNDVVVEHNVVENTIVFEEVEVKDVVDEISVEAQNEAQN